MFPSSIELSNCVDSDRDSEPSPSSIELCLTVSTVITTVSSSRLLKSIVFYGNILLYYMHLEFTIINKLNPLLSEKHSYFSGMSVSRN